MSTRVFFSNCSKNEIKNLLVRLIGQGVSIEISPIPSGVPQENTFEIHLLSDKKVEVAASESLQVFVTEFIQNNIVHK